MKQKNLNWKQTLSCVKEPHNLIQDSIQDDYEINHQWFSHWQETKQQYAKVEFKNCCFETIKWDEVTYFQSYFTDVLFENCDLSNTNFSESNFHHAIFQNCNLTGCNFSQCILNDIRLIDCSCRYANFSLSSIRDSNFDNSNFLSSSFSETTLKNFAFLNNCNLTTTNFFRTSLNRIDLSDSIIDGIVASQQDLKGVIVSPYQALDLIKIFGIQIKE